jgi:glycosyltransferase involved in cell wall biosynthesis
MRVGIVIPHIFMHEALLPQVIFSPGELALGLADGLVNLGAEVTLFTPGPVPTTARNITADLSYFEQELTGRSDNYLDLLKKHPFTFVTLARQVQSELIADAFARANANELDIVHIYTNEEDIALPFTTLCLKPVVFTHHDPFNFLVKYKNVFPKYPHLNWLSISLAQRRGMPLETNWVDNIYHGVDENAFKTIAKPSGDYIAYLGRIIESKGTHLAIAAVKKHNTDHPEDKLTLKIAGKHYAGHAKDAYWKEKIEPLIDGKEIEYVGFINATVQKQKFLGNARALIIPSTFDEPFGMVMIEALACGTPLIGLDSGAIPEVIEQDKTGILVEKRSDEEQTIAALAAAIPEITNIDRTICRKSFEQRFTLKRMCAEHLKVYSRLTPESGQ